MGLEVVVPRVALALEIERLVDRPLHDLGGGGGDQGDAGRELGGGRRELVAGHDAVDHAEAFGFLRAERLGREEELLGLAGRHLPRFHEDLDGSARHPQDRVLERRVVARHDEVAHAGEHHSRRDALALDRGDGRLAEVAQAQALVEVHRLLVVPLALGRLAHQPPLVGLGVADEGLEVVAGRPVLAVAGQDHDPDGVVGVGQIEGRVELVDHRGVLGVGDLGTVEGDRAHRVGHRIGDRVELVHFPMLAGGRGSRGSPRVRSPMMLRWISLVPAKIEAAR